MNFDNAKSWPFVEAKKIVERYKNGAPKKGCVLFEHVFLSYNNT